MVIQFNDFRIQSPQEDHAIRVAVDRVLKSGHFILGREVEDFESSWASSCECRHSIGVASGLDALEIGLRSIGVGPGDEVITTGMTAAATVIAITRAGAVPVLADIDPATALLDLESVERCITKRTRAIILVHLYGQMRNTKKWKDFCEQHSIALIEDCAQSHLAIEDGCYAGSIGLFGAFSFYPTKNLGALGDAGAIVTQNDALAEKAAQIRNYGQSSRYVHQVFGFNSRMDEMQAAILNAKLTWLEDSTIKRRNIARQYRSSISNSYVGLLSAPLFEENHVNHLFVMMTKHRDDLREYLMSRDIQTLIHYPIPVHRQPPFSEIAKDPLGLPATEAHAAECLSIPCSPHLTSSEIDYVTEMINTWTPLQVI